MTKIGIISRKNRDFFVEFSDAMIDVDSFACFDVIFLEKSVQCDCHPRKKKISITLFRFKNRKKELDFLEIRYYANSVVITPFFKIKQHQIALCLFVSGKLRFPRASKHLLQLARRLSC